MKHVFEHEGRKYYFGSNRQPRDDRDWLLRDVPLDRKLTAPLPGESPDAIQTQRWWNMVSADFRINQGAEGTCAGHGATNVLLAGPTAHPSFPPFATVNDAHMFARQLYFDATGDSTYQEGAYSRDIFNVLVARQQIRAYYRIASVDEIIDTVLDTGPVTFASPWYTSMFYRNNKLSDACGNYYIRINTGSELAGYHLYCLTGADIAPTVGPPFVRMENSWGPGWGHNGTARIPIDDLHTIYIGDAYLLTENAF
jgi:hypothetical protein